MYGKSCAVARTRVATTPNLGCAGLESGKRSRVIYYRDPFFWEVIYAKQL
jgi:hypothetical protein